MREPGLEEIETAPLRVVGGISYDVQMAASYLRQFVPSGRQARPPNNFFPAYSAIFFTIDLTFREGLRYTEYS